MPTVPFRRRSPPESSSDAAGSEWIGGIFRSPFFVTDRDEPYRPSLVAWCETPSGVVVGQSVVAPEDVAGAVGRTLAAALRQPLIGKPRRPARIRVADAALVPEVREVLGAGVPIVVGPTPELDELLQALQAMPGPDDVDASYLEDGRVSADTVARLFAAAKLLYDRAPWTVMGDHQVVRVDVPALGVEGACLSIIGNLGDCAGLLVFPSFDAYDRFASALEEPERPEVEPDLGTDWLALTFERGADTPASMRREIERHGWPVAGPNAYPCAEHREADAAPRPLVERDVRILAACASAFAEFFAKHRALFEAEEFHAVCESWFDPDDLEVRFTVPYEAYQEFDVGPDPQPTPPPRPKVGRNEPCPCGSGRKYKKCHLAEDERAQAVSTKPAALHALDDRLLRGLMQFAFERFGADWRDQVDELAASDAAMELFVPWSVFGMPLQGRPVASWYLEERGRRLSPAERDWLQAQCASWLSVWEVTAVEPGQTLALHDLFTGERRIVKERSASKSVIVRDAILARVVDAQGESLLCGVYGRALPPREAADLVRRARARLRRKKEVPPERLREADFTRYLVRRWEEAVGELDFRASLPPNLRNTDGHPLLFTTDHFDVADGDGTAVETALAGLEEVEPPEPGESPPAFHFVHANPQPATGLETTLIGRAWIDEGRLRVETNSVERADALRARIEQACGERIRHRTREHLDPLSAEAPPPPDAPPPPPEAEQLLLELRRRHYAAWVDEPIPALGGQTPREAARTAAGRAALDTLLKEFEHHEGRMGGGFDFSDLRRTLGVE